MTNYNDGKWHGWNGGDCPVHPETVVLFQTVSGVCGGANNDPWEAASAEWRHDGDNQDIIAFRVIKEHKEPREFHAKVKCTWTFMEGMEGEPVECWEFCKSTDPDAVIFREVLE